MVEYSTSTMSDPSSNSPARAFGAGVREEDILEAIQKSGYPLQTVVAAQLRQKYAVQEEWSYVDKDTKEQRTLDIHASQHLYELSANKPQPRVRPTLNLLIECKQSSLPYVFFVSREKPWLPDFPSVAGLASNKITLTTDDDLSTYSLGLLHSLGLEKHAFLTSASYCSTFSKCVRSGKGLELSGSDSYNTLVLPLLKSVAHFKSAERPPETAMYFDAHIVIGIGLLDAPMVAVMVDEKGPSIKPISWIRVTRHESLEADHQSERTQLRALDIVHKDFLAEYLDNHVMPFASNFADLAIKHQTVVANGAAFVTGMGKNSWDDVEDRMQPRTLAKKVGRMAIVGRHLVRLLDRSDNR